MSTRPSHGYYRVEYDGDLIVEGSRDPEHDLARALLARRLTGKVTMLDANTGINIEKAAKLAVSEESRDRLRRRKYREGPDSDFTGSRRRYCPTPPFPQRQTRLLESLAQVAPQ